MLRCQIQHTGAMHLLIASGSVPGISNFFVQGALSRDYHIAMGVLVLYSGLLISLNIVVDIAYTYLDPRVRLQ